jgi:hypothetical protein
MITITFLRRFYSQSIHMVAAEAVCNVSENCLRYSLFPSPTLRIIYGFAMREEGAELFLDTVLRKSLSPRSTKGCDISACLHVALAFPIAASHRIAHGTSRIAIPLRSNQLHFMSTPSKTTHHPCAQASHIGAYLLGIAGSSMEQQYFTYRGPVRGLCSQPLSHSSLTDSVL